MSFLVEKRLRNEALLKIYTTYKATEEEMELTRNFARQILHYDLGEMKIVLDFDDGYINLYESYSGKEPDITLPIGQLGRAVEMCVSLKKFSQIVNSLTEDELPTFKMFIDARVG